MVKESTLGEKLISAVILKKKLERACIVCTSMKV